MIKVQNSNLFFLQFSVLITDNNEKKVDRIIGFGNPGLLGLINGRVNFLLIERSGLFQVLSIKYS